LTDAELIAILLRVGLTGKSAIELGRDLLNRFGSIQNMMNAPLDAWQEIKGLGTAKVAQLHAAMELGRRAALPRAEEKSVIKSTRQAVDYFTVRLRGLAEEHFRVAYLSRQGRLLEDALVAAGTVDTVRPHIRTIISKALRIPYSIINELHHRAFMALKQPSDEMANDTVEAVGFDFIRTPELKFECLSSKEKGKSAEEGIIHIKTFKSEAVVREPFRKRENLETLSMVMLDYNFDENSQVFDLNAVCYAETLAKEDWEIRVPLESLGQKLMVVFIDIYGNEARVAIDKTEFSPKTGKTGESEKRGRKAVRG
jgi:hypothetical protein